MSDLKTLFPDCDISMMAQRSTEWHEIRKDKLTGSSMGLWLADRPECRLTIPEIKAQLDGLGEPYKASENRPNLLKALQGRVDSLPVEHLKATTDARHTAICKILGKLSKCAVPDEWEVDPEGPPPRNPALWAIWNGMRLEKEAVASFEAWSGKKVIEVGFCLHKNGVAGCSPDGLIDGENVGFEGKAPLPDTHIRYLLDGGLPDTYKAQVHGCMAVTGATSWWFQSYCPGLPPHRVLVLRDEFTERMVEGLDEFKQYLDAAREEIASLWDEMANGREAA